MDVFEAVDSRIACRQFLDKPVDQKIVKELIVKAQRAASGGNLQSWFVYALTGKPLAEFKRIVADRIANEDPRHIKSEYPIYPEPMFGAYKERREEHGVQLYGSLGIGRDDADGPARAVQEATSSSSTRRWRCSSPSTASSGPASGPTSAATSTRWRFWRAATASTPARRRPGRGSTTRSAISSSCRRSRCCSARVAIGYGDRKHKANDFRSPRAELHEFCKFYGFDER